jgi:hypothetical protein
MDVLATGAERVLALETALGGEPPKDRKPAAELDRYMRQRFDQHRTRYAEATARAEQRTALIQEMRETHPDLYSLLEKLAQTSATKSADRPPRESLDTPRRLAHLKKIEPKIAVGSGFTIKVPPYDDQQQGVDYDASASPDALQGNYTLQSDANGGGSSAWAGIGINFYAISDDIFQPFKARIDYSSGWGDNSEIFTEAHNNGATNIWVWGYTEQRWVCQQDNLWPSWHSYVSNAGPDEDSYSGAETLQAQFPAFAGHWYQAWVWSSVESDGSSAGGDFSSYSSNISSVQIPWVIFGSL